MRRMRLRRPDVDSGFTCGGTLSSMDVASFLFPSLQSGAPRNPAIFYPSPHLRPPFAPCRLSRKEGGYAQHPIALLLSFGGAQPALNQPLLWERGVQSGVISLTLVTFPSAPPTSLGTTEPGPIPKLFIGAYSDMVKGIAASPVPQGVIQRFTLSFYTSKVAMEGEQRGEVHPSGGCVKPEAPDIAQECTCNTAPSFDYAAGEALEVNQLAAGPNSQLAVSFRRGFRGASSPAAKQPVIPSSQASGSVSIRFSLQAQHGDSIVPGGAEHDFEGTQAIPADTNQLPPGPQLRPGLSGFEPSSTPTGLRLSPGAAKAPEHPYARSIDYSDLVVCKNHLRERTEEAEIERPANLGL